MAYSREELKAKKIATLKDMAGALKKELKGGPALTRMSKDNLIDYIINNQPSYFEFTEKEKIEPKDEKPKEAAKQEKESVTEQVPVSKTVQVEAVAELELSPVVETQSEEVDATVPDKKRPSKRKAKAKRVSEEQKDKEEVVPQESSDNEVEEKHGEPSLEHKTSKKKERIVVERESADTDKERPIFSGLRKRGKRSGVPVLVGGDNELLTEYDGSLSRGHRQRFSKRRETEVVPDETREELREEQESWKSEETSFTKSERLPRVRSYERRSKHGYDSREENTYEEREERNFEDTERHYDKRASRRYEKREERDYRRDEEERTFANREERSYREPEYISAYEESDYEEPRDYRDSARERVYDEDEFSFGYGYEERDSEMRYAERRLRPSRRELDEDDRYESEHSSRYERERGNYEDYSDYVEEPPKPQLETFVSGILELKPDGAGMLRGVTFKPCDNDVFVPVQTIKNYGLRMGDMVTGVLRQPKPKDSFCSLQKVLFVNGQDPALSKRRPIFDQLVPIYPNERYQLEYTPNELTTRIIDLFSPLGRGQRCLIVAPPKAGKTIMLKNIAMGIHANCKDAILMALLVDERPEEVTDMIRSIEGTVVASTFDEPFDQHIRISNLVLERARRLVELGKDVVILMDSLTRLGRACNNCAPNSGRTMSGGLDISALRVPKHLFGSARNIENGGSLTIIATALIETGSKMDEVIFEEFKGTGNMEVNLNRKLAERRIFPAIDLPRSGTRHDELLYDVKSDDMWFATTIRQQLNSGTNSENDYKQIEAVIKTMKTHQSSGETNAEYVARMKKQRSE